MGKRNVAKDPLLYIHQPTRQTPKAKMQDNYVTPKKKKAAEPKKTEKRPMVKNTFFKKAETPESSDESIENLTENETAEEEKEDEKERKKFKDMTLEERIAYFLDAPKHAPVMRCEIQTDERKYRGIIADYQDGIVRMQVGNRKSLSKIPFDTIEEIRLLGF